MNILITGCAGFIGYHTTKRLLSEGHMVTGVDNLNISYDTKLKISRLRDLGVHSENITAYGQIPTEDPLFTFIKADIESDTLYAEYLHRQHFDMVCHLAAQAGVREGMKNPQKYISSNIDGFFKILEYCRHNPIKRLVFASSSSVYGKTGQIICSENDNTDTPLSLYAATKKSNELFAHSYALLYGINVIGLRFFNVYGPWGRPDMAPFLFTKALFDGQPIYVFNNGDMSRDFTYIDDIVEGIWQVMMTEPKTNMGKEKFRIYNIGYSNPASLNDFIKTIECISGKTADRIDMPMQSGDVKHTWADVSKLKEHYGYAPSTSLEKGLNEFIKWYKKYYE